MTDLYHNLRVRTLIPDMDLCEHGNERPIPPGSEGTIIGFSGDMYDISWDNGGWTRWTEEELRRDAVVIGGGNE